MVAVVSAPLFNNDLPLNTNAYPSQRAHDAVADAIVGAAPGATVTVTRAQLPHSQGNQSVGGGVQQAVTITEFNRATTVQDATNIENEVKKTEVGLQFPRDLSGNGGPAFNRTF